MANIKLTADVIAKAAVAVLDNNLVMAKSVHRGYESDFGNKVNGYEVGDTISIRRPDFTVRDGATASAQDVTEGKFSLTVDKMKDRLRFHFSGIDTGYQGSVRAGYQTCRSSLLTRSIPT